MYLQWPELWALPFAVLVRAHKDAPLGDDVEMVLTLEIAGDLASTIVAEWTIPSVPSTPETYVFFLTQAERDAISESAIPNPLGNLRTTVTRTGSGITSGSDLRRLVISDLCIQVPEQEEE